MAVKSFSFYITGGREIMWLSSIPFCISVSLCIAMNDSVSKLLTSIAFIMVMPSSGVSHSCKVRVVVHSSLILKEQTHANTDMVEKTIASNLSMV